MLGGLCMKTFKLGGAALAAGLAFDCAAAFPIVIDDFAGGPDLVSLVSLAPSESASGSFLHAGAVGGVRDIYVISETVGVFIEGVADGFGVYGSVIGTGRGGIIWDGVASGIVPDLNDHLELDDLDFGLDLDVQQDCPDPVIHIRASADLPNAHLHVLLANSADDHKLYTIPLTTIGAFDDYYVPISGGTLFGSFDPTHVRAIGLFHDGEGSPNLDIQVSDFEIVCALIPETSTWIAMMSLMGLCGGCFWMRRRSALA